MMLPFMKSPRSAARPILSLCFMLGVAALSSGCSTLLGQRVQEVKLMTTPPGRIVKYEGRPVRDGETIVIRKQSKPAVLTSVDPNAPTQRLMKYKGNKWLWGDAALLIPGILPGLAAFAIDMVTGAWRDYDNPQKIQLPESEPPPEPGKRGSTAEEDSFKKKTGGSGGSGSSEGSTSKKSKSSKSKSSGSKDSGPAKTSPIEP